MKLLLISNSSSKTSSKNDKSVPYLDLDLSSLMITSMLPLQQIFKKALWEKQLQHNGAVGL